MKKDVKFFCIETDGSKEYIAAISKEAVLEFLGDPNVPTSLASFQNYDLDSLEQVDVDEAKKAKYYETFIKHYDLCADGTYVLGRSNS